jgi:hypothetical protein
MKILFPSRTYVLCLSPPRLDRSEGVPLKALKRHGRLKLARVGKAAGPLNFSMHDRNSFLLLVTLNYSSTTLPQLFRNDNAERF